MKLTSHRPFESTCLLGLTSLLCAGASLAGSASVASKALTIDPQVPAEQFGGSILGGGFKSNGEFNEGSLFSVIPLLNTVDGGANLSGDVLFVEPYMTLGDGGEFGASLGLGYRHLFSNQTAAEAHSTTVAGFLTEGFYVGANGFIDFLNTRDGSDFWQFGGGVEIGTRYLEFRANYYYPFDNEELVGRTTTTTTSRSSSSRTSMAGPGVLNRRTTTSTTTVTTTTEFFEEALEGWDLEASLLLPYVDRYMDLRVVGGYYDFKGDRSSAADFSGWRVGLEARPLASVVVFANWYENDNLYGDDWLAGIRFEIPLGSNRLPGLTTRRRHLAERLFEPVRRQNTSIVVGNTSTTTTDSSTSTRTTTQTIGTPPSEPEEEERDD